MIPRKVSVIFPLHRSSLTIAMAVAGDRAQQMEAITCVWIYGERIVWKDILMSRANGNLRLQCKRGCMCICEGELWSWGERYRLSD